MPIYVVQKDLGAESPFWVVAGTFTDFEQARAHAMNLWERDVFVVRVVKVEEGKGEVQMFKVYPSKEGK